MENWTTFRCSARDGMLIRHLARREGWGLSFVLGMLVQTTWVRLHGKKDLGRELKRVTEAMEAAANLAREKK